MKIEIERKFLVNRSRLPDLNPGKAITQGYICSTPTACVRVRLVDTDRSYLTIKDSGHLSRQEFEYSIPPDDANRLLKLCESKLSKIRYEVIHKTHTWTVDFFRYALADLILAEVELESENETLELPLWIDREVTHDPRFTNINLAINGSPMAYTIGRTSSYDASLLRTQPSKKIGRQAPSPENPDGYLGGWVWQSPRDADAFRVKSLGSYEPKWLPDDFSVYELDLPNGWLRDVSITPGEDGIHHLLVDATIVRKHTTGFDLPKPLSYSEF